MNPLRRTYIAREVVRVAYMAGGGATAADIGAEIGAAPERIYGLCRRYRIKLTPKGPHQSAVTLAVAKSAMTEIAKLANKRGADPLWLAARVLEACANEPVLLRNLIDDVEEE